MSVLEALDNKQKNTNTSAAGNSPEIPGQAGGNGSGPEGRSPAGKGETLREILDNKEKGAFFGEYLNHLTDQADKDRGLELAIKLAEGKLEEGDLGDLDRFRSQFVSTVESVELIKGNLDEQTLMAFGSASPEFQTVLNLVGPKNAGGMISRQLQNLALTNRDRFDEITSKVSAFKAFRKSEEYSQLDSDVSEMLTKYGINKNAYLTAIENQEDSVKAVEDLVKQKYGGFKKAINFLSLGYLSSGAAMKLAGKRQELMDMQEQVRQHRSNIGAVLGAAVDENPDVRKALVQELTAEGRAEAEKEKPLGFKEVKEASRDEKAIDTAWSEYKGKLTGWEGMAEADKDIKRAEFRKEQQEGWKKKKGFFAEIFGALFGDFIKNKKLD